MSATPRRLAPPSSAAAADAHGAVAVAVGLDDGDHLGVGEPAQVPDVAAIAPTSMVASRITPAGQAAHAPVRPTAPVGGGRSARLPRLGHDESGRETRVVRHRQVQLR